MNKKAIGYVRISDSDQSNWSLDGQEADIINYCSRNNIELLCIFRDDGQSAKNFERASWKQLEAFIKKHHKDIDTLLVISYDRFSRNVSEALTMMQKIEQTFKIEIASITQPISIHPDNPYYFQFRAQMLLGAELELRVIRDRAKTGKYRAAKEGRYTSKAPIGYLNAKDDNKKPILVIDTRKKKYIEKIYTLFLSGLNMKQIHRLLIQDGFTNKSNNAIKDILTNPIYAGLIKVPAYYDKDCSIIKAAHKGIVSEHVYWTVQNKLNVKPVISRGQNDEMPLKRIVHHDCYTAFTASRSKGKYSHFWYYVCPHCRTHIPAKLMHSQLLQIISHINLSESDINYIKTGLEKVINKKLKGIKEEINAALRKLKASKAKLTSLQDKYISDEIDKESYLRWRTLIKEEIANNEELIVKLNQPATKIWNKFNTHILLLNDLPKLFEKASLEGKQQFINLVFDYKLMHDGSTYRTPFIAPLFLSKAAILKEKGLLTLEQPIKILGDNHLSASNHLYIEHLSKLFKWFESLSKAA